MDSHPAKMGNCVDLIITSDIKPFENRIKVPTVLPVEVDGNITGFSHKKVAKSANRLKLVTQQKKLEALKTSVLTTVPSLRHH